MSPPELCFTIVIRDIDIRQDEYPVERGAAIVAGIVIHRCSPFH